MCVQQRIKDSVSGVMISPDMIFASQVRAGLDVVSKSEH